MASGFKRSNSEIEKIYSKYADLLYRTAFTYLKNKSDTEDAVQNTFIKLIKSGAEFKNPDHEKAWFIVTCSNTCKDMLKRKYNTDEPLEAVSEAAISSSDERNYVLEEIMALPLNLRLAVYLHYCEGYTSEEIGSMRNLSPSTIRNQLHDAREILKKKLGGDFFE